MAGVEACQTLPKKRDATKDDTRITALRPARNDPRTSRGDFGAGKVPDAVEIEPDAWCAWCGADLPEPVDRTYHQRFCSKACNDDFHNDVQRERRSCRQCGAEFVAMPRNKVFCSRTCQDAWHNGKARLKRMGRAAPGVASCDPTGAGKS